MLYNGHLANPPSPLNCPRGLWMTPYATRFSWFREWTQIKVFYNFYSYFSPATLLHQSAFLPSFYIVQCIIFGYTVGEI